VRRIPRDGTHANGWKAKEKRERGEGKDSLYESPKKVN